MGRRRWIGFLAALGAVLTLTACGGTDTTHDRGDVGVASRPAEQILSAARKASYGAKSVRAAVSGTTDGRAFHGYVDFAAGKGISATISSGRGVLDLIVTGRTVYLKGDTRMCTLLTHNTAVGQLLGGKWLSESATGTPTSGLGQISHLTFARVTHLLGKHHGTLTRGPVSTLNGQQVVALHSTTGVTLWVATTGKPYVMRTVGGGIRALTYSDYGRWFSINPPRHAINLSRLQSPSGGPSVKV